MSADLISVIIPVYQVGKYLDRCVESVVKQTYINLEIILVDDGSTDDGPDICDKWAKQDSRITVIHKKNEGAAEARNVGIRLAKGKYITFVDSDDTIHSNMIEILYQTIKKCNTKVSACEHLRCRQQKLYSSLPENITITKRDSVDYLYETRHLFPWGILYDAHIFTKRMFIKGQLYEDIFVIPRVLMDAEKIAVVKGKPLYYYLQRDDSSMGKAKKVVYGDYSKNIAFIAEYAKRKYGANSEKFLKILAMGMNATCSRLSKLENPDYSQSEEFIYILRKMIIKNMKSILVNPYMKIWEKQMCCYLLFSIKAAVNIWKNHKIYRD